MALSHPMGRIKTRKIKAVTKAIIEKYPDKFSKEYEENKAALKALIQFHTKKPLNIVAGYITRLKRSE